MSAENHPHQTILASPAEPAWLSRGKAERSGRRRRIRWLAILLAASLVGTLIVIGWAPREIARWRVAAALQNRLDGNLPGALRQMDLAIAGDPGSGELYCLRSELRLDAKDYAGGLEDAERAVQAAPREPGSYVQRGNAYQHAGRGRDAVQDWSTLVQLANGRDEAVVRTFMLTYPVDAYNGRAYARALAHVQLDEGLQDIERAIARLGQRPALLDTRGFLYYVRGDYLAALADLERAVLMINATLARWESRKASLMRNEVDLKRLQWEHKQLEFEAAVFLYHRSLVCHKLGLARQAEADRRRVRRLGYEPTEHLF